MARYLSLRFFGIAALGLILLTTATGVLAQNWVPTGSMNTPRLGPPEATLLSTGKVLIAGGANITPCCTDLASAELYDPTAGTFSLTGSMSIAHTRGTATLLPNGKVLVAGGWNGGSVNASAELYDPTAGAFSATGAMGTGRQNFTATLLSSGKVLVTGGTNTASGTTVVGPAEVYDPASGNFSVSGSMVTPRESHNATLLSTGQVLITGGSDSSGTPLASAELYDPVSGTFTPTGSTSINRTGASAALLTNGKVLIAGGTTTGGTYLASAEVYDPSTGTFSPTGPMTTARSEGENHITTALLSNGKVLIAGGNTTGGTFLAAAELYDPATGTFSATGSMATARFDFFISPLPTGTILVAGGFNSGGSVNSAELYTPALPPVAKTGADQTVTAGTLVTLDGSGSFDPNNKPLSYLWTQVAGPLVTLSGATTPFASFTAPQPPLGGITLTFQLTVNNGTTTSIPVTANVTVKYVNHTPVANAGPNQTVGAGSLVTLDGSASFDPDGDVLTYQWSQTGGPTVTLSNSTAVKPTFTAPPVSSGSTTLTFQLTVSDGALTSSALVTITDEHVNHPPVANAGPNQTVNDTKLVTLDGSGSSDSDNDPLTYAWNQVSGTSVMLSNSTAAKPTFTAPVVSSSGATLVFQLTVTDPGLLSSSATTTVTVVHQNPVCSAAQPSQPILWPPNHKLIPVQIVGVTDPDNLSTTISVTSVTQDEPVNGLGDGDTSPDAVIQGQGALLRAERAGGGSGRVYQVNFTATDSKGGTCNGTVSVSVPLSSQGTAIDNGQRYNSLQP